MSTHVQTMNVKLYMGWRLKSFRIPCCVLAQKLTRRDGSSCLSFTRWRGGKNNVHGRGNVSWGPTMVAPSPPHPHPFPMTSHHPDCQLFVCKPHLFRDVAPACSSPRRAVWLCMMISRGSFSEGSVGGIWYFSSSSFLCALPVYCTLSVVQYMQLHV